MRRRRRLKDYRVFVASNQTGIDTKWSEEYDFAKTYKEPAFTAATVADLVAGFKADPTAQAAASESYIQNFDSHGAGIESAEADLEDVHVRADGRGAEAVQGVRVRSGEPGSSRRAVGKAVTRLGRVSSRAL